MAENNFNSVMTSLLKGVDSVLSTKTVVGEPIHVGDTILVPLVDVSFGVGAGAWAKEGNGNANCNSGGGLGGKITPSSVVVLKDGHAKLVNVKNQDVVTKVLDMVPDVLDRFTKDKKEQADIKEKVESVVEDIA